jgi:hypothetical protein
MVLGLAGCTASQSANSSAAEAKTVAESFVRAVAAGDGAAIEKLSGGRYKATQVDEVRAQLFGPDHSAWNLRSLQVVQGTMGSLESGGAAFDMDARLGDEAKHVLGVIIVRASANGPVVAEAAAETPSATATSTPAPSSTVKRTLPGLQVLDPTGSLAGSLAVGDRVPSDAAVLATGDSVTDWKVRSGQELFVSLDASSSAKLLTTSAKSVGKPLVVAFDGVVLAAPTIQSPMSDGTLTLEGIPAGMLKKIEAVGAK